MELDFTRLTCNDNHYKYMLDAGSIVSDLTVTAIRDGVETEVTQNFDGHEYKSVTTQDNVAVTVADSRVEVVDDVPYICFTAEPSRFIEMKFKVDGVKCVLSWTQMIDPPITVIPVSEPSDAD